MKIYKIVLTGGPCAGKTTAINEVRKFLVNKGFNVLSVNETATEMINGGITPQNVGQIVFQKNLLELQLKKEEVFMNSALNFKKDTVLILDRGAFDGKAYLTENEFNQILNEFNLDEKSLLNSYDAVIFLDTAADNTGDYTVANNSARMESEKEAIEINLKTYNVWTNHHNFHKIKNEIDFNEKIFNLLNLIDIII